MTALTLVGRTGVSAERHRVLALEIDGTAPRPSFVDALRIQVSDVAVVAVDSLARGSLPAMVERSAAMVDRAGAVLAVWIDDEPAAATRHEVVLYIVARRYDRALVEIVRMPDEHGADIDRALALKVREVLDIFLAEKLEASSLAAPLTKRATPKPTGPRAARFAFAMELGALGATGFSSTGVQAGGAFAVAARMTLGVLFAELYGGLRLVTNTKAEEAPGRVVASELAPMVGVRALGTIRRFGVGGFAEMGTRVLRAEGLSPAGNVRSVWAAVPTLAVGAEARWMPGPRIAFRLALGLEIALRRLRFAVNEVPILDLGRLRGVGHLSFVVSIP